MQVSERFDRFLSALQLTEEQRADGITKHSGVRAVLNTHYYATSSSTKNSFLVGSWGKSTEIRPPRDIDVMFVLPQSVYDRYEKVSGNRQSQLLQEVKRVLAASYARTTMRGDGQVVVIPFATYAVELAPCFSRSNGQFDICNTNDGGSYKITDPAAEIQNVKYSNDQSKGNTRDLIRMMKRWQAECNVPLKSFVIELLVVEFLPKWKYVGSGTTYYDWMVRDFFAFLVQRASPIAFVLISGTWEIVWIGDNWKSRAETAKGRADNACEYEAAKLPYAAGSEWQKIFGTDIPTG